MKRCLIFLLASILGLGVSLQFSACGANRNQKPKTSIRIGITLYDQYDTYISELTRFFVSLAQQKEQEEGITITIMRENADGNQEAQNNQVESFIEAGCDILCVNLVDRMDASVIIDKAEAAGLPIIFFNRELVEEDLQRSNRLYYVGAEALESGRMQGEIVADLCRSNSEKVDKNGDGVFQYVMLEGEAEHQDAVVRTEYAVKTVLASGIKLERLEDEIANWMRSQAETKMNQWLETHGNSIEIVFANNDDMALGAIDSLKRNKIPSDQWPIVVGIDGTSTGLEAIMLGELSGTVFNDSKGQASSLLDLAYALALDEPLPPLQDEKYIRLPYQKITIKNVWDFK